MNLCLDVLGTRPDGYHDVDMIMTTIELHDTIDIALRDGDDLILTTTDPNLPVGRDNLVYKAWSLLKSFREGSSGAIIHIEKRIPVAAGLAGGSTDAAAVLFGLNELWKLRLGSEKLMELGATLGADVPYFFVGGTARAQGIGQILTPMRVSRSYPVLLVNNGGEIATSDVYRQLDDAVATMDMETNVAMLEGRIPPDWNNFQNVMEPVAFSRYGELEGMIADMKKCGAFLARMSGSGPTVFGLFDDEEKRDGAAEYFRKNYEKVYETRTVL